MNTRIAGYDFARSLAVFGLVIANFSKGVGTTDHGLYYFIQALLNSFMQGAGVATFLVLGGVGISLLTQRVRITNDVHETTDSRKRLIKRAAFLLVVGICCNLIWHTTFLCFVSIFIIIGALLLTVSSRWLWALAFFFVALSVIFIFLILSYFEVIRNWEALRDSNPWTVEGIFFRLYLSRFYLIFSWVALLLIGMWLGRQNVHYPRVQRDVFISGIIVALVAGGALWMLILDTPQLPRNFHPRYISELLGTEFSRILVFSLSHFVMCGTAIAIIGASLMLTEKYPDVKWTEPFIATGQLALTLYVVHVIIGRGVLEVLGVLEHKTPPFTIGGAVIFCICAVIFSHFWSNLCERGPVEWGLRRITG